MVHTHRLASLLDGEGGSERDRRRGSHRFSTCGQVCVFLWECVCGYGEYCLQDAVSLYYVGERAS